MSSFTITVFLHLLATVSLFVHVRADPPYKMATVVVELSSGPASHEVKLDSFATFCNDNRDILNKIGLLQACKTFVNSAEIQKILDQPAIGTYLILLADNPFNVDVREARCELSNLHGVNPSVGVYEPVAIFMYNTMSYQHRKFALDWMKERFSAPTANAGEQVLEFMTPEAVPRLQHRFYAPRPDTVNAFGLGYSTYDSYIHRVLFNPEDPGFGAMEIRSCLGVQLVDSPYHPCVRRKIFLPPNISDEGSLIAAVTDVCQQEMSDTRSPDHKAFWGGYGSLLECVIMLSRAVTTSKLRMTIGSDATLQHLYPKVIFPTLPEAPVSTPVSAPAAVPVSVTGVVNLDLLSGGRNYRATPQPSGATCSDRLKTDTNWMDELSGSETMSLSQGTQDGILLGILENIGTTNEHYVEIGFNNDHWVTGSNTYLLNKEYGWQGLLLDAEFNNSEINLHQHFVTADNILGLFEKYGVPPNPDYISVDIDSQDLWLARKILSSKKYRPRVMSIEYNCHLPLGSTATLPPGMGWNGFDALYGASAGAIKLMANEQGYEVVYFAGFLDMFLVHHSLLQGLCPPSFASFAMRVNHFHTCVIDPARKHKWVEYSTYMRMVSATIASRDRIGMVEDGGNDSNDCRDEYTCTDTNVLAVSRRAALEQHLLMSKATDAFGSGAVCLGFAP